jgi:DNA topoisomerase-1
VPRVGGVFVAKNPLFEALHPRDKSGRDRGQFIDVPGVMGSLGATWNADLSSWMVPKDQKDGLKQAAKDMGFDVMSVPKGMRPLRSRGALASATDPATGLPDPKVTADAELEKRLAIPPAWTDVMVATDENADVLAVGRDEKGRKQTKRSAGAAQRAAADKFDRVRKLDAKMGTVDHRLSEEAHEDDTAAAMMLVRKMGLRPGSTKDTKAGKTAYGASTLQRRHVRIEGDTVHLEFDSKKGGHTVVEKEDAELASVLKVRLAGKAGNDDLFPKANDRTMNQWVDETAGEEFSVKDFRTYLGTAEAAALVQDMPEPMTAKEHRAQQLKVGGRVAKILGNTREESLKSYIDPSVWGPVPGDADADMRKPEVPGETGRQLLKDAFEAGHTEHEELTGGASSESVKRVTLSDGTIAVLKRPKPNQIRRDILSGTVANALGFDQVHTIDVGDGRLLTEMAQGRPGGKGLPEADLMAHVEDPGGREMGLLDWLIRNRDRHGGNWIVSEDGVIPIDHGLTNFGVEDNEKDIPRGVFAKHWLGLTQKPSAWAARNKTVAESRIVRGPKAKLAPKFSKQYLDDVWPHLEMARESFTDEEWAGLQGRFDMVRKAAPDSIPGELPFRNKLPEADAHAYKPGQIVGDAYEIGDVDERAAAYAERKGGVFVTHLKGPKKGIVEVVGFSELRRAEEENVSAPTKVGEPKVGDRVMLNEKVLNIGQGPFTLLGTPETHDYIPEGKVALGKPDGSPLGVVVKKDIVEHYDESQIASIPIDHTPELTNVQSPTREGPQAKPAPDAPSMPGARHSLPNSMYSSPKVEQSTAAADKALRDAGIDLSSAFTRPETKIGVKGKGSYGLFSPATGRIDVDPNGPRKTMTTLHELGHKFDWEVNGPTSAYGSEQTGKKDYHAEMRTAIADYEAKGWEYVGLRSDVWPTLRKGDEEVTLSWAGKPMETQRGAGGAAVPLGDLTPGPLPDAPGETFMDVAEMTNAVEGLRSHPRGHQKYGKYLQRPREIFARAFAQYVASSASLGGSDDTWQEWKNEQRSGTLPISDWDFPEYWTDEDFAPLKEYFDKLMETTGVRIDEPVGSVTA